MREDRGEIGLAQAETLPRLITLQDMRGDLHVHSDWTDGTARIAEMAAAAQASGYEYMALTDHSRRVAMRTDSILLASHARHARSTR